MSEGREPPEGFPAVCKDVVLEKHSVLQAGGQSDVPAHDVDAIIVQCTRQVQARFGRVLFQVEPLPSDRVIGLHGEHVLTLAAPAVGTQFMETATHNVDGLLHRHHLLLADMDITGLKQRPEVRRGAILQDVHVAISGGIATDDVNLPLALACRKLSQRVWQGSHEIPCILLRTVALHVRHSLPTDSVEL